MRSMIKKIALILTTLFVFALFFTGCFQFRMSNDKAHTYFHKRGIALETEQYQFGERNMNFLRVKHESDTAPVAIYVHGSPGSSKDFFNTMLDSSLREKFELVTVDRPGFGYSGFGESERTLDSQAASIKPLLDMYAGRKIIVIGHSYGGPVVCKMAINYSDQISGLMIVAGSIAPELEPHEPWRKPMDRNWIRWALPRSMVASNQEIMALKEELYKMEREWDQVRCATLVLQGTKDNLVPVGNADYAEKHIKKASYLKIYRLEGENHFIPFQKQFYIVDALHELLGEI